MSLYNNENNKYFDIDVKSNSRAGSDAKTLPKIESLTLIETDLDSFPFMYFRRWMILVVFSFISILNVFHLSLYGDLQTVIITLYKPSLSADKGTQYDAANWLSIIHMFTNLVFIFPAMFLLEFKGLRVSCLIGIALTSLGSWIKCASVKPDLYLILIIGQIMCGIAQAFIQTSLVKLSAVWFGKNEVATAIGVLNI